MTASDIKAALVDAHRRKDWGEAARLSQEKQRLKKRNGVCVDCGALISVRSTAKALRCRSCYNNNRYYSRCLPQPDYTRD